MIRIIEPTSEAEQRAYYNLRYEVLRKPWNQPTGSERDDDSESTSIHAMAVDATGNCVGCGRIIPISTREAQIRSMGVAETQRGSGIGTAILIYLETQAKKKRTNRIFLHARENAVNFYAANGYRLLGGSYSLWGIIPHFEMEKVLETA